MEPKLKSQVFFALWNYDEHKNWCGKLYCGKLVKKIEAKYETRSSGWFRKKEPVCLKPESYIVEVDGRFYSLPMVYITKRSLLASL